MFCNFRKRNSNTVKDATCVPTAEEILRLARGKYWAKFDLTNAFSQKRMDPASQHLTAISTPWGCYEWTIMPQELQNSPATWQRMINKALAGLIGDICFAYVDDVIIYGTEAIQEHLDCCRKVLIRLREAGLLVNPMGSVNWIREFSPRLAVPTNVLTALTRKSIPFKWNLQHEKAFEDIKKIAADTPILKPLDYKSSEPVWLIVDASKEGLGCALLQGPNRDTAYPIAFLSRSYRGEPKGQNDGPKGEYAYHVYKQELAAVMLRRV